MADPYVEYKYERTGQNISAFLQARLKTEAEQQGRPFAEILHYYAMERFLSRLSKSRYATKFIRKGAPLFYARQFLTFGLPT